MFGATDELETVQNRAYRQVRHRILSQQFKPGEALPQHRLAKELGIGTNPLREALVRLECDGLIESVPQWGSRVRRWSEEDIAHLYELRIAVECETARACAVRATDEELAELMKLSEDIDTSYVREQSEDDNREARELDVRFHTAIARFARSPFLLAALGRQNLLAQLARSAVLLGWSFPLPSDLHKRLVRAIATRDPDQAEAAMRRHLEDSLQQEQEALHQSRAVEGGD